MDLWDVLLTGFGGMAIVVVVLLLTVSRRRSARDLGSVSSQWIAEHLGKSL